MKLMIQIDLTETGEAALIKVCLVLSSYDTQAATSG